jgi:hypothetical protein
VNGTLTFAEVFRQARAKSAVAGEIPPVQTAALAICGSGKSALTFTTENIEFLNKDDVPQKFGWVQLDFILPGDLSLASDKLYTFTDLETPARRVSDTIGKFSAWAAAGLFAYLIWSLIYAVIIGPMIWFHKNWGIFGDIVDVGYAALILMLGWWLLAIVAGIFASGGIFSAIGHWLGKQTRPLIKLVLNHKYAGVENGLHIINQDWVGPPWDPQAKRALDLIFIGIKLRRRGLT